MKRPDLATEDQLRLTLIVAGIGVALATLVGLFGFHDGSVWRAPRVLEARVEEALREAGYPGIEVAMTGQRAILRGVVGDNEAIPRIQQAAISAAGAGGLWAGGVTRADVEGVAVGIVEAPFVWRARREERRIVLSGAAPSEESRAALLAVAAAAFPNAEAVDEMHVAGGAPAANWAEVAGQALQRLASLTRGEARLVDEQIVLLGEGSEEAVQALRRSYQSPPAPFRVRVDANVAGQGPAIAALRGLDLNSGDAETCTEAFGRLMDNNVIQFAPGSAAIDRSSMALLDVLASVALRCDRFTIQVQGHTDNQGARELNMDLSRTRAEAVAAYLASQGVTRDRLRAEGFGPDRPRASNATPAGQAQNRRIEFNVSG